MVYTAFAAIAVGAAFGNPAYTAVDAAAVLLGLYFLWPPELGSNPRPAVAAETPIKQNTSGAVRTPVVEPLSPAQWVELSPKAKKKSWARYLGCAILLSVIWFIFSM
jgi:hypothetical protein